ncbi:hypothetical protein [Aureimonas glaciei]|uniref:Uncharacterized protein n=1 Tax=Aureimonas glaciei TaxID=1776957 RepID=A0A917DD96_9HYPH|nr:hypothetical protein [Aureimonas glaciei]GGD30670.1 hypothetical protein GCM10011335_37170 [Aureimonas glaciei]
MPQALGLLLFTIGAPIGVVNAVAIGFGATLVNAAIGIGLSYVASLLAPKPEAPKPSDGKTNIAEPTAPRVRHYGQVRAGGVIAIIEPSNGKLHKMVITGTDEVKAIVGIYIDDIAVTLDGSGQVNEWKERGANAADRLIVKTRLGLPTETAYSELVAAFPSKWTTDHRGDNVTSALMIMNAGKPEDFSKQFPSGANTTISLIYQSSIVWDPRLGAYDD